MKIKSGFYYFLSALLASGTGFAAEQTAMTSLSLQSEVVTIPGPLKPSVLPVIDQSIILGRSGYYTLGNGMGDAKQPWYESVEAGAFRVRGGVRALNRPIVNGCSIVVTGDKPIMQLKTFHRLGVPYWLNGSNNSGSPQFGTLKLGVIEGEGKTVWMESLPNIETTFWPGYTDYVVPSPSSDWTAHVRVAPIMGTNSMVCRVRFEGRPQRLIWSFGGIAFQSAQSNQVAIDGNIARFTEPQEFAGCLVLAGWDGVGSGQTVPDKKFGKLAEFTARTPQSVYNICAHWGASELNPAPYETALNTLEKNKASQWWPEQLKVLKEQWLATYREPVTDPEEKFRKTFHAPEAALVRTVEKWDSRRAEFVVKTPDPVFNALMNWARCVSEYHHVGPGYNLGLTYPAPMHISVGWYGKEWGGDHSENEMNLRYYAIFQLEDKGTKQRVTDLSEIRTPKGGSLGWGGWGFRGNMRENNTAYWVDQVWQNYRWTGNRIFLKDMWPHVRRAVEWELTYEDPDSDGLFRSHYEYWNCDSGGKGPKGAAPTAICYGMLVSAANIAHELGESATELEYRALAQKSQTAANRELWNEQLGVMGTIGADGILRTHPQNWDEYYGVQFGLLNAEQGRRAMRWIESHHGFTGDRSDVRLLMSSDWWPHRWSNHWVPVGDTLLAVLAGMKCGDVDLWWPYAQTVVRSAYRNNFPGIGLGISNTGAAGGDMEDVDADDPHTHMTVRGLFGIEPDLQEGKISICPAFPSDWKEASIKTPDVSYNYRREGDFAVFRIHTPRPLVKHVRANLTGQEIVTTAETESVVKLKIGPQLPELKASHPKTILAEREPKNIPTPLTEEQRRRLLPVELSSIFNSTQEDMTGRIKFAFDHDDETDTKTLAEWWCTPTIALSPMEQHIKTTDGVTYLTAGREAAGEPHKSLLALASWKPYALPAGTVIPLGRKTERLYLLLQNYVHPSRCYIPNGEVVLIYTDGERKTVQLIPPFNLDCYYQHFSREGVEVKLGKLVYGKWSAVRPQIPDANANSLMIPCDSSRILKAVEIRATCSETILGLAGLTLLTTE
jgi:hypothetical protein